MIGVKLKGGKRNFSKRGSEEPAGRCDETGDVGDMKTEYKYIVFKSDNEVFDEKKKRPSWECRNKKHGYLLGLIIWCSDWKQYCYHPERNRMYSRVCLEDIVAFIKQL